MGYNRWLVKAICSSDQRQVQVMFGSDKQHAFQMLFIQGARLQACGARALAYCPAVLLRGNSRLMVLAGRPGNFAMARML